MAELHCVHRTNNEFMLKPRWLHLSPWQQNFLCSLYYLYEILFPRLPYLSFFSLNIFLPLFLPFRINIEHQNSCLKSKPMYSSKIKGHNNSNGSKRNKRFKVYHHQRPSLPSLHQIFPSPPPQIVLPPLSSFNSLPLFRDFNELYPHPYGQNSDEQILEGASIFFFGSSQQHLHTPPPPLASSSTVPISRGKRGDFVLFDSKDSPPSVFKGKLVPDLGRH